eukprot:g28953.t1
MQSTHPRSARQRSVQQNRHFLGSDTVKMQIFVHTGNVKNETIILDVNPSDTIGKVKQMIEESHGYPTSQQRLIFEGTQLEDACTLGEAHVFPGSSLQLLMRLTGGFYVVVPFIILFACAVLWALNKNAKAAEEFQRQKAQEKAMKDQQERAAASTHKAQHGQAKPVDGNTEQHGQGASSNTRAFSTLSRALLGRDEKAFRSASSPVSRPISFLRPAASFSRVLSLRPSRSLSARSQQLLAGRALWFLKQLK